MTTSLTTVSIGMPVYNGQQTIKLAIESLLSQAHGDFVLQVSDNGSTDGTPDLLHEYSKQDSRVQVTLLKDNMGAAANFESLLQQANGRCFMWAACDDRWEPDFLQEGMRILDSDPDVGFVFPTFKLASQLFPLQKKVSPETFWMVEHHDRRVRVLNFANLHPMSHKCNLVYSLFRRDLIVDACAKQDIGDDGLLSMVILGMGRGKLMDSHSFLKCYSTLWPGMFTRLRSVMSRPFRAGRDSQSMREHRERARPLFPEFSEELDAIERHWDPDSHGPKYQIVDPNLIRL